jgi:hypothetical protein
MSRRLAIAFAVLAGMLISARAHALPDGDLCDEEAEAAAAAAPNASLLLPAVAPPQVVTSPTGPLAADGELCHGDRLTDDPSCWPESPTGTPPNGGFAGLGGPDVLLAAMAALPRLDCSPLPILSALAGAEHPGYARGIDRPPRSF